MKRSIFSARMVGRVFLKGLVAMIPLVVTLWAVIWLVVTAEAMLGGPMATILPEGFYVKGMGVVAGLITVFCVGLMLNVVIVRVFFHRFEAMLNRLPLVKSVYGAVKDLLGFFTSDTNKGQQVVMVTLWPEQAGPVVETPASTVASTQATQAASPQQAEDTQKQSTQAAPEASSQNQGQGETKAETKAESQPENQSDAQSPTTGTAPTFLPPRVPMKLMGLVTRTKFNDLPPGIGDEESVAVYLPMSYQLGGFTVIVKRWQIEPINMSTEDALRFAITAGMNATKTGHALAGDPPPDVLEKPAPKAASSQKTNS